ncbi:TPA: hypothetical protein EYO12_02380 [Candidatus Saccharibacteria bacterium]|nr:hypothetical protein [Candidatus Saccharibacteria bacterium]HIO87652.1 hypothetical protein [Candidatus Saccharibacteria bacterium]
MTDYENPHHYEKNPLEEARLLRDTAQFTYAENGDITEAMAIIDEANTTTDFAQTLGVFSWDSLHRSRAAHDHVAGKINLTQALASNESFEEEVLSKKALGLIRRSKVEFFLARMSRNSVKPDQTEGHLWVTESFAEATYGDRLKASIAASRIALTALSFESPKVFAHSNEDLSAKAKVKERIKRCGAAVLTVATTAVSFISRDAAKSLPRKKLLSKAHEIAPFVERKQ